MDPARIAIRALAAYIYLLYTTRATGKRVVAQATPFDFVVALVIGDLIDDAVWAEVSLSRFAAAVGALFSIDIIVKMLAARYDAIFRVVAGHPRLVLEHGNEKQPELRRLQMNERELGELLRHQDIANRKEVRAGYIEIDGELSVLKEDWAEGAQRRDRDAVKEQMP
jgi:uncharacterized membrane protein YcaP (DUF421 family)